MKWKESKGISPFISVIMLIAFVLVVAGIFFGWISQFIYIQREEFQFCSGARIVIYKAYYNPESKNLNIVIYNLGNVPLKGFSAIILYEKNTNIKNFEREINPNDVGLLTIPYEENIKTIVIQSTQCKNAQDMINIYSVEGLV